MDTMSTISIEDFYKEAEAFTSATAGALLPTGINQEIGHFNVFNSEDLFHKPGSRMTYNRRAYYKISLVRGRNLAEYADKIIPIEKNALLFATPKIPYNWSPLDSNQKGHFCIFTSDFLVQSKSGVVLDELPIFKPGGYPIFEITDADAEEMNKLFEKIHREITSDYLYKYDLIRNFVVELIHYGQKLQPLTTYNASHNASARVSSLFIELLERQFPIESPVQKLKMRTPKEYADQLSVHTNHLNKVLKENTGKTTTEHISERLVQEARILLRQTNWNISEIAYSLGFEQLSHFSNFFKKQTAMSPIDARGLALK